MYHRQSSSVLSRNFDTRKHSPVNPVIVAFPQRRSQQFPVQGRSNSPSHIHSQGLKPKVESQQRIHTQMGERSSQGGQSSFLISEIQRQQALKNNDLISSHKIQNYLADKQTEKLSQTKTTTVESVEEDKQRVRKQNSSCLQMQKSILDRDLQIIQLQRENKLLREQARKAVQLEKDMERILKENNQLRWKLEFFEKKFEHSPQSRQSDYIQALTEVDKIKIESILGSVKQQ